MKQIGGDNRRDDILICFPRNDSGRYDPTAKTTRPATFRTTFKYAKEARFCLGVAKVKRIDGVVEGRRSKVYEYSKKNWLALRNGMANAVKKYSE